ncbi:helix-turn-helix transcriptional regulator [uncultured Draconibacterium sp.]|uniref:helix-turn-helix transcriptional regulator n=1 Tax=uncultured Draconibacterium sp. TaxID=1573823 RepID=UPI002AA63023|nr:helix-turn-helix transcriptional regulator [uncultured Draconibacterium sp.]
MQQPELGKLIAEKRKAKGLTQDELVEKCKLNVRTLQRIEAGEVMPRSFTLKVIAKELDLNFYERGVYACLKDWIGAGIKVINLKSTLMKKVSILSATTLIVLLGAFMFNFISGERSEAVLRKYIEQHNRNTISWFNSGKVEKIMAAYASDACFYRNGHPAYCCKEDISTIMQRAINTHSFKLTEIQLLSLKVTNDLAIEKSLVSSELSSGEIVKTINIQEWQRIDGDWLIVNDIDVLVTETVDSNE